MAYLSINEYSRKWIFTHNSLPIPEQDLTMIKPMTQARSAEFWKESVSKLSPDAERLSSKDWPAQSSSWKNTIDWMQCWDADSADMPAEIVQHIDWQDDVTVYFCYEKYNVVQTSWGVFKRHWKNFLFFDDGPILLGRRRKQALWFKSDGKVMLGLRP
ncbi:DUF2947 domain-containing protein [Vibrio gallicus]|uniref:DUF2947 domain-containing protein n=1 Tax=Vibrio gallicus TaxID=190897 RepID=UPI0021C2EB11|nr:DUF2947 domain-containing protein [Vibrio gallicus]